MITIDEKKALVHVETPDGIKTYRFDSPEAFAAISEIWLRVGWDVKYVYSFTWLGRPIIQLPEDMFRVQEIIFSIKPDVIVETGVAHGGSLMFYASLCKAMGKGRVIGVDIEIRPHNRRAIESHPLFPLLTLIEGDSAAPSVFQQVKQQIKPGEAVLVLLDSKHSKDHVLAELRLYSSLVTSGSYIVVMDGIMAKLVGAPRAMPDWDWNNPVSAIREFISENPTFSIEEPKFAFNEGAVTERVTYWPSAWLKRTS